MLSSLLSLSLSDIYCIHGKPDTARRDASLGPDDERQRLRWEGSVTAGSGRARGVWETCTADARAGAARACDAAVAVARASIPRGGLMKTQTPRNRSRRENGAKTAVRPTVINQVKVFYTCGNLLMTHPFPGRARALEPHFESRLTLREP